VGPRLTLEQFEALRSLDGCSLANAIEIFKVRLHNEGFVHPPHVHCIFHDLPPMLGYAVTGRIRSATPPIASSLPPPRTLSFAHRTDWWDYILTIPAPRVVVLKDVDASPGAGAFMGEVHSAICRALGSVGYVTNGAVRDLDAVRNMGFHFFAGHVSVSHAYVHIVDFGEPVEISGLTVRPGELIHGDRHGVQTIPKSIAVQIPEAAARLREQERLVLDFCQSSDFSLGELRQLFQKIEAPGDETTSKESRRTEELNEKTSH
jgi:4-hydroxy-4-methyl-2-oxoglutarate aldolase